MKTKNIVQFILLILLCIVMFGCASHEQNNKTKEIEFWTLQLSDFSPYINSIISDYEKIHPDVKIKWVDVPFSEGEKRALAEVMSNKVPDIINMNPGFSSTLASRGTLANLKKYIRKEDYIKYLKESWDASSLGEIIFGIPWYITTSITIYNAEILEKAGLNPDNPPKNYEDLKIAAEIIKKKTGKYAFMPNLTEDGKMLQIFNENNIPITNKERSKALFNTREAVNTVEFWADLYNRGLIPPESITEGHRASLERYQTGESAFIFTGANFLKMIKENAPQIYKTTRVAPKVTGRSNKIDFALMNLVVPKKAKYKKEAVDFALYLTNSKNQLEFCKLAPILPSALDSLNSDFFRENSGSDLLQQGRSISATQLKRALKPIPALNNHKDLYEIIDYASEQALLKQKPAKQALKDAAESWNKILQDK